jgi:hypothetical protein
VDGAERSASSKRNLRGAGVLRGDLWVMPETRDNTCGTAKRIRMQVAFYIKTTRRGSPTLLTNIASGIFSATIFKQKSIKTIS